ncbi:MAG: hypothetical protein J6Q85_05685 [Clostridia bacterium]|nr:hypothetical protein [Clostridia bacterium]
MSTKKSRLNRAEEKYCEQLHEWLTNPKNEDLPNDVVEPKIEDAFNEFFQALIADENECAEYISKGGVMDEIELLPLIFEHFRNQKIYEAIKSNCEIALAHKYSTESKEVESKRKSLISYMKNELGIL